MNKVAPRIGIADDKGTLALRSKPPEMDGARKEKILERARKRMERAISAESENRKAALDDRMFKVGNQWPTEIMAQRAIDKRPCLTVNKIPTFIHQITNDQRQNRPSINISPVGDRGDPDVAKMYRGLIRFIERDCAADIAYDTAFDDAVTQGWGWFRILTEWEEPKSFNLVAVVRRIRNPFTVYADPAHQDPTGADMKWAFCTEMVPRDEFDEKYPDAAPMPYTDGGIGEKMKNWVTKDEIRVAEYFEIEYETRTLVELDTGFVGWKDELDDLVKAKIKRKTIHIIDERESRCPKVMWYKITAVDVLMEREWQGSSIPLVKVIGDEEDIEGKVTYSGIVRHAKDPQRMLNYWRPLALDTRLPTPTGWTTMGEAKEGDWLIDDQGKPTRVIGTSPVHLFRDCFRVEFDDGSHIIADAQHPWVVEERKGLGGNSEWFEKTVTTADLTPKKHIIKVAKPLDLPDADLPLEPYLLGVWLGDGRTDTPQMTASDVDVNEMAANLAAAGVNVGTIRPDHRGTSVFTVHGVRGVMTRMGVLGNKHIPDQYLRASKAQRLALLQGLMDTDGSVSAGTAPQCSFTTTLPALADGFVELARTLGIKVSKTLRAGRLSKFPGGVVSQGQDSYQLAFRCGPDDDVFRLARKRLIQRQPGTKHIRRTKRHRILSVTAVPSVPVKCVAIDSPSHLFLAGVGMVPTHNTAEAELVALQPKAPWIGEEGQFEGHEDEWKNSNVKNQPYLSYKGTSIAGTMIPPPQRQQMAGVPAGVVQAGINAAQDMQAVTGIRFDATMNERMIDESGKAIRELRRSGDLGAFHYVDNLARSLRRAGEILVELIPKIYNDKRVLTILRDDDKEEQVKVDPNLNKPMGEEKRPNGKTMKLFNPTFGKYGVTVTIGPSYATKRIEASENMMAFMKALPQTAALVVDLFAAQQDWPGAEQIAARLAKTIPPHLMSPDMKDVTPQIQAILSQQEQAIQKLSGELRQAMAALADKGADRQLEATRIQHDFEAKLLKVVADIETKMAAVQEKATSNFNTHIGAQLNELGTGVTTLIQAMEHPPAANDAGASSGEGQASTQGGKPSSEGGNAAPAPAEAGPPAEALQHLRPNRITRFGNGQKWSLGADGKPVRHP